MKRDFDLIRKLLIFFDEKEGPEAVEAPPIEGYEQITIKYHLILLYDAGLLRCEPVKTKKSQRVIYVLPFELTWTGHEFLEKIRNETTWRKILATIKDKGGALAFSVINQQATSMAIDTIKQA